MGDRGKLLVVLTTVMAACGVESTGGRVNHLVQGTQMQGMQLEGVQVRFDEMRLSGMPLREVRLGGTTLTGELSILPASGGLPVWKAVSGKDFVGAELSGTTETGGQVRLRIAGIEADPQDESGETLLYTLLYQDPARGSWEDACTPDGNGVRLAIPVSGTWDKSGAHQRTTASFTFGCTSGVIAKCVRWGYRPWRTVNGKSLADYHQACTRMARADYCGDGVPHTRNGTLINIYDDLGIQARSRADGMVFEAAWTPDGASCVQRQRYGLTGLGLLLECPGKISLARLGEMLQEDGCNLKFGTAPQSAALLRNRSYVRFAP